MLRPRITLIDPFEARRSLWKRSIERFYPGLIPTEYASLSDLKDPLSESAPRAYVIAETDHSAGLTFALDLITIQEHVTVILLGYAPKALKPHPRLHFVDPFTEDEFSIFRALELLFAPSAKRPEQPAKKSALTGSLSSLSVLELIQIKAMQHRPVTVRIQSSGLQGLLHFCETGLFHATTGVLNGASAVNQMIGWTEGTFEELPLQIDATRTITESVDRLLLNAVATMDEQRNAQAS